MAVQQIDHFESASASASHRCESRLLWGGSERHTLTSWQSVMSAALAVSASTSTRP